MPKPMRKKGAGPDKKHKKKTSILTSENIAWVDYKDVNLLRRFMSERAKIRARRVTGNDQQQQAAVARAIKVAREMALLPYSVRQVQQRSKGKGRGDRDRDRGELGPPEEAQLEQAQSEDQLDEDQLDQDQLDQDEQDENEVVVVVALDGAADEAEVGAGGEG